jgi:hypothetical protein
MYSNVFKSMTLEEKQRLLNTINSIKNEHTRKETLDKYGPYLGSRPVDLSGIKKLIRK